MFKKAVMFNPLAQKLMLINLMSQYQKLWYFNCVFAYVLKKRDLMKIVVKLKYVLNPKMRDEGAK